MQLPTTFNIHPETFIPDRFDEHIRRRLSDMRGYYADGSALEAMIAESDPLTYQVYERRTPEVAGELLHGISVVHSGRVGEEFFMTKGHFHQVLETAEVYHCLYGQGMMVMETPEGEARLEELLPGRVLYVPPRWAHRSVNTGQDDLVTLFIYPGDAGHDYGSIASQGFRKLVVQRGGRPAVVDNPRWLPPGERS